MNRPTTRRARLLLLILTALAVITGALAPVASASRGPITRAIIEYDLTQSSCEWDTYQTWCYLGAAPQVHATSYYDSVITAKTYVYHDYYDINFYRIANNKHVIASWAGTPVYTIDGEGVYVLCYTHTTKSGEDVYMDKVAAQLVVGGKQAGYIFYMPDHFVSDYVIGSVPHC